MTQETQQLFDLDAEPRHPQIIDPTKGPQRLLNLGPGVVRYGRMEETPVAPPEAAATSAEGVILPGREVTIERRVWLVGQSKMLVVPCGPADWHGNEWGEGQWTNNREADKERTRSDPS